MSAALLVAKDLDGLAAVVVLSPIWSMNASFGPKVCATAGAAMPGTTRAAAITKKRFICEFVRFASCPPFHLLFALLVRADG
jgi:hypothetical protein